MTKQEKIKEAYGEYFEEMKPWINDNGWFDKNAFYNKNFFFKYDDLKLFFSHKEDFMIPVSIAEIENNNGWIKIESKDDLPNNGEFYVYSEKYKSKETAYFDGEQFIIKGRYPFSAPSHYLPILEPKNPLY
jgi:hypothetical protein